MHGQLYQVSVNGSITLTHLLTSGVLVIDVFIDQSFCLRVALNWVSRTGAIQVTLFIYISNILYLI